MAQLRSTPAFSFSLLLVSGIALLMAGKAYAEENWSLVPSISQSGSYNSNPVMSSGDYEALYGSVTTPELKFISVTPTTSINAMASVSQGIYNLSRYNSTDFHGKLLARQKMDLWDFGLNIKSDYDTVRTSELTVLNTNTSSAVRHTGNSISPDATYSLSERDRITVSGNYYKSEYGSAIYSDYHVMSANTAYYYDLSPLNSVNLSISGRRYQNDGSLDSASDSYSPSLGWTSRISPTLTAQFSIGPERYRTTVGSTTTEDWKWKTVYSAQLISKEDSDQFTLLAKRSLQPYLNGKESFLNTLSATNQHNFNSLLTSTLGASYQFSSLDDKTTRTLDTLISANAGLSYHVTENLDITASYQYREQELSDLPGQQRDNMVMVGLTYRPVLSALSKTK